MVSVFYSKPQRLDVYVENELVAPTNAEWNTDQTDYTLKKPVYAGANASHTHTLDLIHYNNSTVHILLVSF